MEKTVEAWICLGVSAILFVAGFLVPPMGVVDGSVLKAGGILLGFASLFQAPVIFQSLSGFSKAKFTKGDMAIEVNKRRDDETHFEEDCEA